MVQFETTPQAFANSARLGLYPGFHGAERPNAEMVADAVWPTLAAFNFFCLVCPRVVASSNPDGLKFANAFGVISN
jgi:hypothetical protein